MKRIRYSIFIYLAFASGFLILSSCGEENSTQPVIEFVTGSSFISKDTALLQGTVFNVGVNASKTGTEGLLTNCKISRSLNNGTDSIIQEMNLVSQGFTQYYTYQAGDSGNVERYTFTVTKQDGLKNSISLAITGI